MWSVAVVFEFVEHFEPAGGDVGGTACAEAMTKDEVGIVIVHDHDVLVASGRSDGEFAGLVGVRSADLG